MTRNRPTKRQALVATAAAAACALLVVEVFAVVPEARVGWVWALGRAGSHDATNAARRPSRSAPSRIGAWPWSGTVIVSIAGRRARIADTVSSDSKSEFCPRSTIKGTRPRPSNCGHIGGSGRSKSMPSIVVASFTSYVGTSLCCSILKLRRE